MGSQFYFKCVPAMVLPCFGAWLYFILLAGSPVAHWIYTGTKIFTLAWPVFIYSVIERKKIKNPFRDLDLSYHLKSIPLGLASGGAIVGLMLLLYLYSPLGIFIKGFAPVLRDHAIKMGIAEHYIAFTLFLSLVHSGIEEYFWRWFVFGRLRLILSLKRAYLLAGLSFAAHHYVVLYAYFPLWVAFVLGTGVGIGGGDVVFPLSKIGLSPWSLVVPCPD